MSPTSTTDKEKQQDSRTPVIRKIGLSAYKFRIPKAWKNLYLVISKSKLKPYIQLMFDQQAENSLIK